MKKLAGLIFICLLTQSCGLLSDYGNRLRFGAGEIYYKDGVTQAEAQKLGDYLQQEGFFDEETPKSVQLVKNNDTYVFRMVTDDEYIRDEKFERTVQFVTMDLSADVFNDAKVDVHLTDDSFRTQKEIPFFGVKKKYRNANIYRELEVDASTAEKVTEYLINIGFIRDNEMSLCYRIEGDDFVYEFVAKENAELDQEVVEANKAIAGLLSADVLNNKPIRMNFLNTDFSIRKSYPFEDIHQSYVEMMARDSMPEE